MDNYLWGIDLGGTKIEGVILEQGKESSPIVRERIDTESDKGYEHILNRISELVKTLKDKSKLTPNVIGFGTPGILDPSTQRMKNCNTTCLNEEKLKADLENKLEIKVQIANDANCFTLAESTLGAAKDAKSVFGVIMGTGVGGGIAINQRIHNGRHGIAGEWGHNVLIPDGEPCYCGKKGCVENVISGPALQKYHAKLAGNNLSLKDIVKNYQLQDVNAVKTMEHLVENFGKAISVVINILDPEVIVLGGGVSNIEILYSLGVAEISKHIFNNTVSTKIVRNSLGDSAGVFGAAMLCCNN